MTQKFVRGPVAASTITNILQIIIQVFFHAKNDLLNILKKGLYRAPHKFLRHLQLFCLGKWAKILRGDKGGILLASVILFRKVGKNFAG
jgi:hypothetical protein